MQTTNFINLSYFFQKLYDLLTGGYSLGSGSFFTFILSFISFIRPLSILLSLLFLTGIIYCLIRTQIVLNEIMETAHPHEHAGGHGDSHGHVGGATQKGSNARWEKIVHHLNSANQSDWRLAILECDIVLDEMLTSMSYHGETLRDKLKAVERSDFLSIDKAWEAHRVRNAIAHEGSNFLITDREARRVVGLYEEVFREFHYI